MFRLDRDQSEKLDAWMREHEDVYTGAIGGRYTYSFTPTSLGTVVKVYDAITKETIDLSDYDTW